MSGWTLSLAAPHVAEAVCGGGDPDELFRRLAHVEHRVLVVADVEKWRGSVDQLYAHPWPTIAAVRGTLSGNGLAAALSADARIASDASQYTFASPDGYLVTESATVALLARAVGTGTAAYWLLTRRTLAPAEAREAGFVQEVVSDRDLEDVARATAESIAAGAPIALRYTKEALRRGSLLRLADAIDLEADLYSLLQTTMDRQEGVSAFRKKRNPSFHGR
jgi:enoyl-CoA hydratase/carnithine racemase